MLVLGVDEAGRGPVLGPMTLGGVVDTEKSKVSYREMGCKDSKLLSPARREELAQKIRNAAKDLRSTPNRFSSFRIARLTLGGSRWFS